MAWWTTDAPKSGWLDILAAGVVSSECAPHVPSVGGEGKGGGGEGGGDEAVVAPVTLRVSVMLEW